jgi:tetratricopeptide (TPR) repeat protein
MGKYEDIGEAVLIRKMEGFHVEIEIFLRNKATLELLSPESVQAALLHEIGHAIGLWGHSEDPSDVMYFAATAQQLTARDVATWLKVRETPVNTPFHEQAISALRAEIQKEPQIAKNYYSLGAIYADLGDYPSAINAFQKALEIDPLLHTSAVQVAQIFQQQGVYELAIAHYRRALRANPSAEILGALGTLSLLQGEFDLSVDFLQQALRLAPESATLNQNLLAAHHRRGFQRLKENQYSEAIQCFNRGLVRFPLSEILLYDLAVAYESAGEYQKALDIYERVLRLNPHYAAAQVGIATTLNNLGVQHARNKDWDKALECYQWALAHDPGCWQARQNLEATLMRLGWEKNLIEDLDGAILTYQRLLEMNPKQTQAHNNLGIIYFKKKEHEKAVAHFEAALAVDGNYEEAKTNLNYVKRQHTVDIMKKVIGSIAIVLFAFFVITRVVVKRAGNRKRFHPMKLKK